MNSHYKSLYLKYKTEYLKLKNGSLLIGGGVQSSHRNSVEYTSTDTAIESQKEAIITTLFTDMYFDNIYDPEGVYDESFITDKIKFYFKGDNFKLYLNSVIKKNLDGFFKSVKIQTDVVKLIEKAYRDIATKNERYKIDSDEAVRIQNQIMDIDSIIAGTDPVDEKIVQLNKEKIALEKKLDAQNKKIKSLFDSITAHNLEIKKLYWTGVLTQRYFNNVYKTIRLPPNVLGESYEEYVNNFIKSIMNNITLPLLYLSNINCTGANTIFGSEPDKMPGTASKYEGMKGELDGLLLLQTSPTTWYPIAILEMKNNINLITEDLNGVIKLKEELSELSGTKEIHVGVGRDKKIYNIDLDGFKDINFFYCVNMIQLIGDKYQITNSVKIYNTINSAIAKYFETLKNRDKFTTANELAKYILSNVLNKSAELESLEGRIKEIESEMTAKKEAIARELRESIDSPMEKDWKSRVSNVVPSAEDQHFVFEAESISPHIVNYSEILSSLNDRDDDIAKFRGFFSDPKNKILHIQISKIARAGAGAGAGAD